MEIREELFKMSQIFDEVFIAPSSDLGNIPQGEIPFIGRTATDNGIQAEVNVDTSKVIKGGCITVSMVGTNVAKFHQYDFTCSQNILVLRSDKLNKYNAFYLVAVIDKYLVSKRYGYGHPVSLKRFKKDYLPLPVNLNGSPDYAFMESYMKQKEQESLGRYKQFVSKRLKELQDHKDVWGGVQNLDSKGWREFYLQDVFNGMQRGKRLKKANHKIGRIPYISSTAINNGIDEFIGNDNGIRIFSNCLTVANSGSVGATFYHPYTFVASDHVTKLEDEMLNEHTYMFISVLLNRMGSKYSFNREINDTRIKREKIMLPVNQADKPDYEFMENYMKQLEYKKLSKYLSCKV